MSDDARFTLLQHPGMLWQRTIARTQHALACGALHSIPTQYELIEDQGVQFLVRIIHNLVRKEADKQQQIKASAKSGQDFNPFLPYEEDLFVVDISDTHVCILNKFNVVNHHLLIITRAFEEQESRLTFQDFEALWACLAEVDGVGFYNAGARAGASQRHKHLQLVPLPFVPEAPTLVPIEAQLLSQAQEHSITEIPAFPFAHGLLKLNLVPETAPTEAAAFLLESYLKLLQKVGCYLNDEQVAPYNLLVTRQWMFLVPRSQESFAAIGVNSLGFAGALLVRDAEQMRRLKEIRPMTLLQKVAIERQ